MRNLDFRTVLRQGESGISVSPPGDFSISWEVYNGCHPEDEEVSAGESENYPRIPSSSTIFIFLGLFSIDLSPSAPVTQAVIPLVCESN